MSRQEVRVNNKLAVNAGNLRNANLRQRLLRASRAVNTLIVQELQARGFGELRSTHTALLSNLELEGASLTSVASRAGMTKQAMGRLADELIRFGYIQRSPDPIDRRAAVLTFTDAGLDLMQQSFAVMAEIEKRCAKRIGKNNYQILLQALSEISEELEKDQS